MATVCGEDLLEAALTVRNVSNQPQRVELAFATSVQPSPQIEQQQIYIPLNAAGGSGDSRFAALGVKQFLKDCNQRVGRGDFQAHYLEPMASYPNERETRALLLAPVVDISHPQTPVLVLGCSLHRWNRGGSALSARPSRRTAGTSGDASPFRRGRA